MTTTTIRTRAELEVQIAADLKRYHRMPARWEARRLAVMRDIERMVDEWLAMDHGQGTAPHR